MRFYNCHIAYILSKSSSISSWGIGAASAGHKIVISARRKQIFLDGASGSKLMHLLDSSFRKNSKNFFGNVRVEKLSWKV